MTLQPQYSLLVREIESEIVPASLDAGIGLLPWSPLGGGWLSGKYKRDQPPAGATRLGENPKRGMEAWQARNADARTWDVIDAVEEIAGATTASAPAQVALAWLADRPAVTSVILGARTTEQLADNLAAADLELTAEETERLTEASQPRVGGLPVRADGAGAAQPEDRGRPLGTGNLETGTLTRATTAGGPAVVRSFCSSA